MQDANPVPDPRCGRCKKQIARVGRTEAVYQDGLWFHTACHREGADQLWRAMRLSKGLKDVQRGGEVSQSPLCQREDPPGVHVEEGEARFSPHAQRWLPSTGEQYFLILGHGMIARFPWHDTALDHAAWHFGNCFSTYAQAQHAREQITALLRTFHYAQP
jgi:hypothetical protein